MFGGSDEMNNGTKYKLIKQSNYDVADENNRKVMERIESGCYEHKQADIPKRLFDEAL